MKRASWSASLVVSGDGVGVVAHAGSIATRLLADRTGLTAALSTAMARRDFVPGHNRGRVLADVAVTLADGGEAIADIDVLRHQGVVLGAVASPAMVRRTLDEVTPARVKKDAGWAGSCPPPSGATAHHVEVRCITPDVKQGGSLAQPYHL